MPRIPEYNQQVSANRELSVRGAQPSDLGGDGFSNLGHGLQQGGSRLAEAQRFINSRQAANEITRTDMEMLRAQSELAVELDSMVKNWTPVDGEIVPAMQEKIRQRMERAAFTEDGTARHETVAGRQHFEKSSARLSANFLVETTQAQSKVMGQQVIVEHAQAIDNAANVLQTNPKSFDVYEDDFNLMIDNPNGRYAALPAVKREELKRGTVQALARATVQGQIRNDPRQALADLKTNWMGDKLNDKDMPVLINQAETAVHALDIDGDRAYREQERQRVATARAISNKMLTKLAAHDADPTNPPLTAQDLIDSGLGQYDDNGFQSLISVLHTRSKEGDTAIKTNPAAFRKLFNQIHADPGDPKRLKDETAIQDAFGKKQQLSFQDMTHLRKEFQDSRTPEGSRLGEAKKLFIDGIKTQITKSNLLMGKIDTDGDMQMLMFTLDVNRKIDNYRKAGKDPHDLFDPKNPDFVGSPAALAPFQKSMQQSLKSFSEKMKKSKSALPELTPEQLRKPGESYGEWKKRVNP